MKHPLLLALLLLVSGSWAQAQSRFSAGVLLAPFSSYAGDPRDYEASFRYSTGIALGVQAQFDLTTQWSLASGLWYETASVKSGAGIWGPAYRIPQRTIAIPMLLNFRPSERTISPYLSAGTLLVSNPEGRGLAAKALLAAGLSYRINPHLTLQVQPALTLGSNHRGDRGIYPANRQVSLQTQLLYHFSPRKTE